MQTLIVSNTEYKLIVPWYLNKHLKIIPQWLKRSKDIICYIYWNFLCNSYSLVFLIIEHLRGFAGIRTPKEFQERIRSL